jgi:hypothetical protein
MWVILATVVDFETKPPKAIFYITVLLEYGAALGFVGSTGSPTKMNPLSSSHLLLSIIFLNRLLNHWDTFDFYFVYNPRCSYFHSNRIFQDVER